MVNPAILFAVQQFMRGTDLVEDVIPPESINAQLADLAVRAKMEGRELRRMHSPKMGMMCYVVVPSDLPRLIEK